VSRKRFSERSKRGKAIAILVGVVSLIIVGIAERDLHTRPEEQIRGRKLVWRLVGLNALGALGYLRWGRVETRPDRRRYEG
jgi:hypothetical protein